MKLEKSTKTHVTITFTRKEINLIANCTLEWSGLTSSKIYAPEKTVDTKLSKIIAKSKKGVFK